MGEIQTITINGREYDRATGLPVGVARLSRQELRADKPTPQKTTKRRVATASNHIHSNLKSSARIDTRFARKPLAKRKLAYEKYGAQAEAALERALARRTEAKKLESTQAQAQTQTQAQTAVKPATSKVAPAIAKPAVEPAVKAHIPAPAPAPTRPTQKVPSTPASKLNNPQLETIFANNRKQARVDGFSARSTRPAAVKNVQPRSLQQRKNVQPVGQTANDVRHASQTFNIPKQPVNRTAPAEKVVPHPIAQRAQQVQRQKNSAIKSAQAASAPSASMLKNAIVNETLEKAPKSNYKKLKSRPSKRRTRIMSFASGFVALAIFAGYVTYLNVPNISVRVAAAQAGIDASYPGYKPNGYRLSGPVAYSDGEVQMKFASKQDGSEYTLRESSSSWNSSTLLENLVREASGDDYSISKEKGITVYHYGGNAAWVSGGILYQLDSESNLTPEEVRRIATSV